MTTLADLDNALQQHAEEEWNERTSDANQKLAGLVDRTILGILDRQTKRDVIELIRSDLSRKKGPWIDNRKQELMNTVIRRL